MNAHHAIWVEKYRPSSISDYIFYTPSQQSIICRMVEERSIPHLLFSGPPGCGKTTLALLLLKELQIDPVDTLIINASDENSVDVIRDKIKSFISTFAVGAFKVVLLEEADYVTHNGQAVLRRLMEEYSDSARFILTCNYENKVIPAIKSRSQHFRFTSHDVIDVTGAVAKILLAEKVKFDLDLLDKYVRAGYPDIRKVINLVQQNSKNNTLLPLDQDAESGDYKFKLLELISADKWKEARVLACKEVPPNEWEDVYRFLYENLDQAPKFKKSNIWEEGIVIIADHLYRNALVADQEINAAAMFIKLTTL